MSDTVELGARCIGETAKALRVDIGTRTLWVPKSVVHDDSEVYRAGHGDDGSEGRLVVARWFAEKEGLE